MDKNLADWLGIAPDATTFTARLARPVEIGDKTYDVIVLVEPTLGQMEEAAKTPGSAQDSELISIVSAVPVSVARALPASEYRKAMAFLGFFINAAPPPAAN